MLALMEKGIERSEKGEGVLAGSSDLYTNEMCIRDSGRSVP